MTSSSIPKPLTALVSVVLVVAGAAAVQVAHWASAVSLDNGLALTPPVTTGCARCGRGSRRADRPSGFGRQ